MAKPEEILEELLDMGTDTFFPELRREIDGLRQALTRNEDAIDQTRKTANSAMDVTTTDEALDENGY